MRLKGRVSKLEKKTRVSCGIEHPSVIFLNPAWRRDSGQITSDPCAAYLYSSTGWIWVRRDNHENIKGFEDRVNGMVKRR